MRYRFSLLISLTLTLALGATAARPAGSATELPSRLTDQEFWQLSESMSEPNGMFQSDNLLSNEVVFARILPDLVAKAKPGGVYLGVGPEQNFTYMAATSPRMAFITDIRRGNLHLQLMYKACSSCPPTARSSSRASSPNRAGPGSRHRQRSPRS
jgi:hypothetical protein